MRIDWAKQFRNASKRKRGNSTFGGESQSIIEQVQQTLNDLGWSPALTVDGSAGPLTQAAVRSYQAQHGLTVDGLIGPQTLASMKIGGFSNIVVPSVSPIPGLKASVVAALPKLFGLWEGQGLSYMYTDSKGYVTTGTGNLIDPIGMALALEWRNPDGSLTSQEDIANAWNTVKSAWPDVESTACASLTTIRLSKASLDKLMLNRIKANHEDLKHQYKNYVNWPADAQMAIHSKSWAWGTRFAHEWGQLGAQFMSLVNAPKPDFIGAADVASQASVHEESINHGIIPRDQAEGKMFANAASVLSKGANPNTFFYPNVVSGFGLLGIGLLTWFVGGAVVILATLGFKGKVLP